MHKLSTGTVIFSTIFHLHKSVADRHTSGSYALAVFTDKREVLVYSLPALDFLHTLPLPAASSM